MAAILPSGMRAISTEISPETGAGGFILPNDHVDVILSRRDKEAEKAAGVDVHTSETILSNVRVLAIDQTVEEKNGQRVVVGKTATLELAPRQAETLARVAPDGHAVARAAQPGRFRRQGQGRHPTDPRPPQRHQHGSFRRHHDDDAEMKVTMRDRNMGNTSLIRTTLLIALITAFGFAATGARARAAMRAPPVIQVVGSDASSRFVPLGVGKSVVIDLPRDIKDVLVADPKIANAVIRSARRAYIIGAAVGQTNVFFFDAEGRQIGGLRHRGDARPQRPARGAQAGAARADIRVEGLGEGVVLTGNVSSPIEAQQAFDIASRLVDDGKKVVNGITVHGRDQVMLKVTVAEVQRDVIKQLGIDLSGSVGFGTSVVNFNTTNPFTAFGQAL